MKDAIEIAKAVLGPKHVSQQIDAQWKRPLETMARAVLKVAEQNPDDLMNKLIAANAEVVRLTAEVEPAQKRAGMRESELAKVDAELKHLRSLYKEKADHCAKVEAEVAALRPKLAPVS